MSPCLVPTNSLRLSWLRRMTMGSHQRLARKRSFSLSTLWMRSWPSVGAMVQQGAALTALVSHLTSSSDLVGDFGTGGGSGSSSISMRGLQRRERMQSELAAGTSTYFFQLQQQISRRMNPSLPVPRTEAEMNSADTSLLSYMEKYGGFRNQRTLGIVLWMLGHAVDNAARGDLHRTREHLALP